MKNLHILLIALVGCGINSGRTADFEIQVSDDSCQGKKWSVTIHTSNEQEFNTAVIQPNLFMDLDSVRANASTGKSVEIVTASERISFDNINPQSDTGYFDEAVRLYYNLGYSSKLSKHLVYASYYEYGEYLLIDHNTSSIDTLNGLPFFSTDLQKVFNFWINPYMDTEVNGVYFNFISNVQIHSVCDSKLFTITEQSFDFIPIEIKWSDNSTILVKAVSSIEYYEVMSDGKRELSDIKNFSYKRISIL